MSAGETITERARQTPISKLITKDVYRVSESDPLAKVVNLFLEQAIGSAPVVNDAGQAVGFVSKTDLVRSLPGDAAATKSKRPTQEIKPWADRERLETLTVGDIMTPTLYTFSPNTSVADATAAMAFEGIHHIPVVSNSGTLEGLLSTLDLLEWIARENGYTPSDGQHGHVFNRPG